MDPRDDSPPHVRSVGFEGAEHREIGNKVKLKMLGTDVVKGSDFAYPVAGLPTTTLSFGDITALAGDFYADWSQPISDATDPAAQLITNADSLFNNTSGYLTAMLNIFNQETVVIDAAIANGQDVVKVYMDHATTWLSEYILLTSGWFLLILMTNWDHFGDHAIKCYKAGHQKALQLAKAGTTLSDLRKAYAYDAFASHFLTDLFSTGHIRTPRKEMHMHHYWNLSFPADMCSLLIHDEDSATGLIVKNPNGDRWLAYGDKQLFSAKSRINFQRVVACVQAGADEIKAAFHNGTIPNPDNFQALKLAPDPTQLVTSSVASNPAPLFAYDAATQTYRMRHNIVDQSDPRQQIIPNSGWTQRWLLTKPQLQTYLPSVDLLGIVSTILQFYVRPGQKLGVNFWGCVPKVTSPTLINGTFTWLTDQADLNTLSEAYHMVSLGLDGDVPLRAEFLGIDRHDTDHTPNVTLYRANIQPTTNTIVKEGTFASNSDPDAYPTPNFTEKWLAGDFVDGWDIEDPLRAVVRCPSASRFSLYLRNSSTTNETYQYNCSADALHSATTVPLTDAYHIGSIFKPSLTSVSREQFIRVGRVAGASKLTIEAVWGTRRANDTYNLLTKYYEVPVPQVPIQMQTAIVGQLFQSDNTSNIVLPYQDSEGNFKAYVLDRANDIVTGPTLHTSSAINFANFGLRGNPLGAVDGRHSWFLLNTQGTTASRNNDLVCVLKQSAGIASPGKIHIVVNQPQTGSAPFKAPVVSSFDDPFSDIPTVDILPVSFEYPGALSVKSHAGLLQIFNVQGVLGVRLFAPDAPRSRTFKIWGVIPRLGQPVDSWWANNTWMFRDSTTFFQVGPV